MPPDNAIAWLLQNSNPVIRWRAASELFSGYPAPELSSLKNNLLALPLVQTWLNRLNVELPYAPPDWSDPKIVRQLGWGVHSSKPTALENVLGKLAELGLQAGMPTLDERMQPLRTYFCWQSGRKGDAIYQTAWETLVKSIIAWGLLRLGYQPDGAMKEFLLQHLQDCHKIAHDQVYDLYADPSELVGLPKAWTGKPILKQEVMINYHLPLIHDIYILANFPDELKSQDNIDKINDVIAYILDPHFQALPDGYGYAWIKERRTVYGWGWSPHLPDFKSLDFALKLHTRVLIQRLELVSGFPQVRHSHWFQEAIRYLENYQTGHGGYCFPAEYLCELPSGYYVTGAYLGLGENRRRSLGFEIESTFRMSKILAAVDYNY